jgi:hypothetical protein
MSGSVGRGVGRRPAVIAVLVAVLVAGAATAYAVISSIDRPATVTRPAERLDPPGAAGTSLVFGGTGSGDVDRVKIPFTAGTRANVGATDFTIELWLRGDRAGNTATRCTTDDAGWIEGNIVVDRDVYGPGDRGDFGLSLASGRVAWGASLGGAGATVCGATDVLDGRWHHVAVTRSAATGALAIWVDGRLDASIPASPATGDVSYRVGRSTSWPASDPYLVLGAEKHDAGPAYPSFAGAIDDLRISTGVRYTSAFGVPSAPHPLDASTAALYRFDEPSGTTVVDAVGTADGELQVGANGPTRSVDTPFG